MRSSEVCVVGAGISGMSVANNLTEAGVEVCLVDQNPYPGGRSIFYGCKATAACVHCGVCLVRQAVADLRENPPARTLLSSQPQAVRRNPGEGLAIQVESNPNPIDWQICIECGRCVEACPEGAIRRIPGWKYCLDEGCNACGKCLEVCPVGAITLEREKQIQTIPARSVVIASGFEPFDPLINRKYGGSSRVITGSELEHLFYRQEYLPQGVKDLAFIQCVGSRNIMEGQEQCSRVCCAYALRMAGRLKQEFPELGIDFYYMDLQSFGKNFPEFLGDLQGKINLIQSNPVSLRCDSQGRPLVRYEHMEGLSCREKAYDLVVLSQGICPPEGQAGLADAFGLDLAASGFLQSRPVDPAAPVGQAGIGAASGVFPVGACRRPMRIEECLEDAAAVSRQVLQYLGAK